MTSVLYLIAAAFGIVLAAYYVYLLVRILKSEKPDDIKGLSLLPLCVSAAGLVSFVITYFLYFDNLESAAVDFSIFPDKIISQYSENYYFFLKYALIGLIFGAAVYCISVFAGEASKYCEVFRIIRAVFLILMSFVMLMGTAICTILYAYDNIEGLTVSMYVTASGFSLTLVMGIGFSLDIFRRKKLLTKAEYVEHLKMLADKKAERQKLRQKRKALKK